MSETGRLVDWRMAMLSNGTSPQNFPSRGWSGDALNALRYLVGAAGMRYNGKSEHLIWGQMEELWPELVEAIRTLEMLEFSGDMTAIMEGLWKRRSINVLEDSS